MKSAPSMTSLFWKVGLQLLAGARALWDRRRNLRGKHLYDVTHERVYTWYNTHTCSLCRHSNQIILSWHVTPYGGYLYYLQIAFTCHSLHGGYMCPPSTLFCAKYLTPEFSSSASTLLIFLPCKNIMLLEYSTNPHEAYQLRLSMLSNLIKHLSSLKVQHIIKWLYQ